jgi:hypothetical protein
MNKASIQEGITGSLKLQPLPGFSHGFYDTPTCVVCGCTENAPCLADYSCFWVTMNSKTNAGLCSECIGF